MKVRIFCLAILLVVITALSSHAQNPSITSGLNWLSANQLSNGSWGINADTIIIDTTEVIKAKSLFGSDTSSQNAASWLMAQETTTVDELSRKLISMTLAGSETTTSAPALINARNQDNGWGYSAGYSSTPLDTSLALQALKTANYPNQTIINSALAYLASSQNSDGGWGFSAGDDSNIYLTALVSATLQQFPQMTSIATAVSKATTYLLAHQNPDGGFGTVYETALTYAALLSVSANNAALGSAVNYLTTNQSGNGSWNDDPYSTALVLKALYLAENRPSPPPPPPAAGKFTGTVLDATTRQGVSGVAVVLESGTLINTVTDAAGGFTMPDVPPGPQKVAFSLSGYASTTASGTSVADATLNLGTVTMTSTYSTGTISGTILDPTGRPLSDVAIAVSGSWSGSAVTDTNGAFSFSYVTPGDVTITATKTGYQSFSGTGRVYARTTLSISPRLNTTQSQVTTGAIVGRVIGDMFGFPIDHLPGEPGVKVTLSGGISVEPDPDNGGNFSIQGLAPNTYQVTVGMSGFISQTFRLIVVPGVTTDLGTIRLIMSAETITLTGKVTDSITGLPIPAAEVVIVGSNLTGRADFAGTYVIADIKEPRFTVKASATSYVGKTFILYQGGGRGAAWSQQMDIPLAPLETKGSLTGAVVDAATNQPLSGATLTLASDPAVSVRTDTSGIFTFAAVPMGLQQVGIALDGYSLRILTTTIMPGMVNNVGNIPLSPDTLPAVVRGKVTDGVTGLPFAGAGILVNGSENKQTSTNSDGIYAVDDVVPGTITVTANAATKAGYYPASFTAPLEPGGILVFSPSLFTNLSATVGISLQTDKTVYSKGETVGIAINLKNLQAIEQAATLRLQMIDPSGMVVYETNLEANLTADGSLTKNISFPLPQSAQGGICAVTANMFDSAGSWIGAASNSFGVAVSRITVTPVLPAAFSSGANPIAFNLVNNGDLAVLSGTFKVTLKDPDGQLVAGTEQAFSLGIGESKTVSTTMTIPPLKFGIYTLAYAQSDETRSGGAMEITLPNAITIDASFDSNSHRVRNNAGLTLTLTNTGRFNLDAVSTVTAAVPDAALTETKNLSQSPAVGSASGSTLLYHFNIPANLTAGEHNTIVTVALPSGSATTKGSKLVIFAAALSLAPLQETYAAGGTISQVIVNSGGADAMAESTLSLYDSNYQLIATKSDNGPVAAGGERPINLQIPTQIVDGSYRLLFSYRDLAGGQLVEVQKNVQITGIKATLSAATNKELFLSTESINTLATITNQGNTLSGGSLELKIMPTLKATYIDSWGQDISWKGAPQLIDARFLPKDMQLEHRIKNGDFEYGNLTSWELTRINGGVAEVEKEGTRFSGFPTEDIVINGNYAVNIRSNGEGYTSSSGLITSDWFIPVEDTLNWLQRSESLNTYFEARVLDTNNNILKTASFPSITGDFGAQQLDISDYKGQTIRVAFLQHTTQWGYGWYTLVDDVRNGNAVYHPSGLFESETKDYGIPVEFGTIGWLASVPAGTAVKFQIAANNDNATWNYVGPDGTSSTYYEQSSMQLNPAHNGNRYLRWRANLATSDTTLTPVLHQLTISASEANSQILWQNNQPVSIAGTSVQSVPTSVGTLNASGKMFLKATLKNDFGQTIASSIYPFYVAGGTVSLEFNSDKQLYKPGETVTISGKAKNLASVATANLALSLKGKHSGGMAQPLFSDTFSILSGGSQVFTVLTTAGEEGTVSLTGSLTQNDSTLAEIADQYEISSPKVAVTLSGPDNASSDPVTLTLTLINSGKIDATITVTKSFNSPVEVVPILAGQKIVLQYQEELSADTTYTVTLSGDLSLQLTKSIVYLPPKQAVKISAKAVTDRISYNANEKVGVTATITCLDAGTTGDSLAETVLIVNSSGEVLFSDKVILPAPDTGRVYTNSRYWHAASYQPGVYTARLVMEGGGAVLAATEATFTISSSSLSAAGLAGSISPAMNPVYLGIEESLAFTLINGGNEDLPEATLRVSVINPDTQAIMHTYTKTVSLPRQETFTDSVIVPTSNFGDRDYLAVLQITLPGMAQVKTLAGAPFSVKIAPPPVLLLSTLSSGAVTNNQTLNLTGSATGVVAMKSVTINATDVPFNADGSFSHATLLQTGDYVVKTVATDILDHTATDIRTITLDQLAPSLTVTTPSDNIKTAISPVEVKGSVDETSTVTVTVKESGQTLTMNGKDFSAAVLPLPRWNTIEITARDLAGNTSSQKRSVLFDDQKPSLEINEPPQDIRTNQSSLTIAGTASDPYTAVGVTVSAEGEILTPPVVNGIFSQVLSFSEEKLYPVTVTASNGVGTQTVVQRNVIYDKTPPTLTIAPVVTPTNASSQTVTGTREEGTVVAITCASAAVGAVEYPTTTTWRVPVTGLQQGENRLQATATDLADNQTTVAATILYVSKAPEVTISATPNQIWPPDKKLVPVVIAGNVVTCGSDIKEVTISVADEYGTYNLQGLKFGDTILLEAWRDGNDMDGRVYTITAVVTDQAGNRTTKSTTVVVPHDMGK